jgi:ABC-type transport system involved in multi-copper enzyme maturation permease subunit
MQILTTPPQVPYPPRYIIDPVAFFIALIGGPLLVTALSFWMLFIPVFALAFGGPVYLIVGTPVLLWYLRNHDGTPSDLGILGIQAMGVLGLLLPLIAAFADDEDFLATGLIFVGFGMIFAAAWAYCFGWIYQQLRRDFFAKPRCA